MNFAKTLEVNRREVALALGYKNQLMDRNSAKKLEEAAIALQEVATPRWVYRRFVLQRGSELIVGGVTLSGKNIAAHLAGCDTCLMLAVTLGTAVEQLTRSTEASDMAQAVLLDMAASVLVEQYADLAEEALKNQFTGEGLFVTGRYSPGYGDLPLALQPDFLRLLDAPRAIGLTTNENHLLLPRKSITALLGVAAQPVKGQPASCAHCAIRGKCNHRKEGKTCGSFV